MRSNPSALSLLFFIGFLFPLSSIAKVESKSLLGCKPNQEYTSFENLTFDCREIESLLKTVPIEGPDKEHWAFVGETKTRKEIESILGQALPPDVIPMGFSLSRDPSGNELCTVFDVNYWDVPKAGSPKSRDPQESRRGFLVMALQGNPSSKEKITNSVEFRRSFTEFSPYSRVLIYGKLKGAQFRLVGSKRLAGDFFDNYDLKKAENFSSHCDTCSGWLCAQEKIVCYSHFDKEGFDQIHVLNKEPSINYFQSFGIRNGKLVELTNGTSYGTWEKSQDKWIFSKKKSPQD